jgi:hypothetical protein
MHTLRRSGFLTFAGMGALLLLAGGAARTQEKGGGVDLKVVKYTGLAEEVAKHRGKIVVVDFWGTY